MRACNSAATTRSIVTGARKKGKKEGKGERERERQDVVSHVDVDAVYLDTDGSLNQPTASNKHHLAITHAYRAATTNVCLCVCVCVRVLTNSGDKPVIRHQPGALRHVGNSISSGRTDDTNQGFVSR